MNRHTAAKLIHNCWYRNQQSVLGQFSIGRVGQFSISTNKNGPEFRNFVSSYIHHLPLKKKTNFQDQLLFLKIMNKGNGITDNVVKILQASAMASIIDGTEHINHRHLDNIDEIMANFNYALRSAEIPSDDGDL
ncbi:hypothetical protein DND58_08275 [Pseudomonas syringae pv. pisi]|nr:hypothetical protein DND62_10315 [Pseudomonas syringae pv. pisi]PYD32297.1 hypothetical protein DND58_08275 [Pseudomonas syringae pv. pisi]